MRGAVSAETLQQDGASEGLLEQVVGHRGGERGAHGVSAFAAKRSSRIRSSRSKYQLRSRDADHAAEGSES
jgi:hypothetical protein